MRVRVLCSKMNWAVVPWIALCKQPSKGRCKTQTLDYGLDYGLNYGLDYGLDYGVDRTANSVLSAEDYLMLDCPMSRGLAKQQEQTCVQLLARLWLVGSQPQLWAGKELQNA